MAGGAQGGDDLEGRIELGRGGGHGSASIVAPWTPAKKHAWTRRSTLQPAGRPALHFHDSWVGIAGGGLIGNCCPLAEPVKLIK
jgi:hypothetical protein